jgi:hypothetical protein
MDTNLEFDDLGYKYSGMVVPPNTQMSIRHYMIHGYEPGVFVSAMLAHEYDKALYNADTYNRQMFWAIAMWIRENLPDEAQGSYDNVNAWCKDKDGIRTHFAKLYNWDQLSK